MAEKDIREKILISYSDVFADCANVLLYEGLEWLKVETLQPAPTESFYRSRRKMRNQFCDRSFYHMRKGRIKAQYIIENETKLRRRQILRKVSYQGGAYRDQLDQKQPIYPVIGMVLDWTGKGSRIPLSLHKLLAEDGAEEEELKFADNAELKIFHMKNLPEEIRAKFTSDLGFVADYLNEGNLERRREQKIVHVEALCEMMYALTGDDRFTNQVNKLLKKQEKGEVRMCEYIDMLEARGESRLSKLIQLLLKEKQYGEIDAVSRDERRRKELYRLYKI